MLLGLAKLAQFGGRALAFGGRAAVQGISNAPRALGGLRSAWRAAGSATFEGVRSTSAKAGGKAWGKAGWDAAKGAAAGGFVGNAIVGGVKGGLIGGAMAIGTGNTNWIPLMAGMGMWRGGAKGMIAGGTDPKRFGWFAPNRLTRNFALGSAIGVATDNPNWGVYGAVGAPAAGWIAKTSLDPRNSFKVLGALGKLPFDGGRALSGLTNMKTLSAMSFMGVAAGGAVGGYKTYRLAQNNYEPVSNSVTSGYFPGGAHELGPGRARGIANNNLSTEGLTLALHQHGRRSRIV